MIGICNLNIYYFNAKTIKCKGVDAKKTSEK